MSHFPPSTSSYHLSVLSAQVLQLLLHALQRLQEVFVLLGQPLALLEERLHLALGLSHALQLKRSPVLIPFLIPLCV